ncbi:MAG: glycosyltransferase family 2 protein [Chthoniobacterales bacterium]|nr:glycosyltransferase family 2 protein [Chthoniobacterales bacterium]
MKDSLNSSNGTRVAPAVSLSVIFPAFNEEANIQRTVESARLVLPKLADTWEIILVNDGSKDATTPLCDELAERYPEVRAIHHVDNRGYGAALKSGILAARHDFIFFTDSDGQFDLEELKHLIEWAGHYDIVTGYRGKRQDPPHRLINAFGWKMLVRMVLGVKVRDIDCAFKVFQRSVFDRVQIRSVGAMVNTEILAQANAFGMKIHEVRVSHYPRQFGKSSGANLRVILKAFKELMRLYRQLRTVTHEQDGLFRTDTQIHHKIFRHYGVADEGAVSRRFGTGSANQSRSNQECFVD